MPSPNAVNTFNNLDLCDFSLVCVFFFHCTELCQCGSILSFEKFEGVYIYIFSFWSKLYFNQRVECFSVDLNKMYNG